MLDSITPVQWLAYAALIRQDRQEEEEKWRDRLEYLARFWNNEAVEQVQKARQQKEQQRTTSDEQFSTFLKDSFGREITAWQVER
jgi:hypothetical protein